MVTKGEEVTKSVITKNLASERVRISMNQEELATALGTNIKTISQCETNAKMLPAELAVKAASLFGCSVDYLYGRTDDRLPR